MTTKFHSEKGAKAMKEKIKLKLVRTFALVRFPCTVCGGTTERVYILCEGIKVFDDGEFTIRACEQCLKAGNIDARLQRHVNRLAATADYLHGLIGKLDVPTFAQWKAREDEENAEENAKFVQLEQEAQLSHTSTSSASDADEEEIPF